MDTWPIIILANDQKCCYYQSSIQYIASIITTILHPNRDTTWLEVGEHQRQSQRISWMAKYTIIIEKGEGNYSAYCPDLPGVVSAGDTEEETAELMKEAIELHLEGLKEDRIPIPKPTISARYVEVVV